MREFKERDGFFVMLAACAFAAIMVLPACADAPKGKRSLEIHKDGDSLKIKSDTREPADKEKE